MSLTSVLAAKNASKSKGLYRRPMVSEGGAKCAHVFGPWKLPSVLDATNSVMIELEKLEKQRHMNTNLVLRCNLLVINPIGNKWVKNGRIVSCRTRTCCGQLDTVFGMIPLKGLNRTNVTKVLKGRKLNFVLGS